ncbi:DUF211 domain-containing protein [Desulfurococcaceae archaeon MEX13E-LK6-19]|nr:DUF211 domain-containing protein [Desulfurococcaceae archaeon MEX13E-LK6-19]
MIKRVVLDVIIPKKGPSIVEIAEGLSKAEGVEAVNITVKEIDMETENIIVVIQGNNINFDEVTKLIEEIGGVIHSIDQVVAGEKIVEIPKEILEEL